MALWDYSIFWNETRSQLKAEFKETGKEHEFALWIEKIEYIESQESKIELAVPSTFFRDQLKRLGYIQKMDEKLTELSGHEISLDFVIRSKRSVKNEESKETPSENDNSPEREELPLVTKKTGTEEKNHPALRSDYTFENYVPGENNSFAYNAGIAVTKNPGHSYNPVLIYGGVGLGKTHLMQAIGNASYKMRESKIIYVSAEDFTNEFTQALLNKTINKFKNKYRSADMLLIDDIHFLQGKEGTQEELFYTFDALYGNYKQMVFTCDRPVSELKNLTARLRSRFERGLNVDLQPPNFETRCAILEKKIQQRGVHIKKEILELIAKNISTNVRDLESSLTKLIAYAELVNREITLEIAQQQLRDSFCSPKQANITVEVIQRLVSDYFSISIADIKGKKRTRNIVLPRQIAMYIAKELTEYSTTELGSEFGGRDHTTVMHSCQKIDELLKSDSALNTMINTLTREIKDYKKT